MRLTLHTDYALRVLIYVGSHPDELVRTEDVSVAYGISHNHLTKVVRQLGQLGYLSIQRGRNGGIALGKDPSAIRIDEVVKQCEPDLFLVECFNEAENQCPIAPVCGLAPVLADACRAFLERLAAYTLADLLQGRQIRKYRKHLGTA